MSEPRLSRPPDLRLPCPDCGPHCRDPRNRLRPVLGIWRNSNGSETRWCIRCHARDHLDSDDQGISKTAPSTEKSEAERARAAAWLWSIAIPIAGRPTETYLREGRSVQCRLPASLRCLPAERGYTHAMIAAFGTCEEPEPGLLAPPGHVTAVHFTRLSPDGRDHLGKSMLGPVSRRPIMLAPPNDALALIITEGIEDALSLHQATGLGAWAAGSAGHMAKLADTVPAYVECVTIAEDDNGAGHKAACQLEVSLIARGIEARRVRLHEA